MFDYLDFLYDKFGVREIASAELATRPDNKLGTDEDWDYTEGVLRNAIERMGSRTGSPRARARSTGRRSTSSSTTRWGARGRWGRSSSTASSPRGFGCKYVGADNAEHMPWVIHRALFGSIERFIGILIEHYGGAFPFWLAPVQVRILPVGEGHREAAEALAREARGATASRSTARDDTVGKRIRNAEVEKIPYVIVYGDKESDDSLAVREHGGKQRTIALAELREGTCYSHGLKAGADRFLTSGAKAYRRFNRVVTTRNGPLLAAVFVVERGG